MATSDRAAQSRPAIFHIGANKAGSTTLQRALFAQHPQVFNVGKPALRGEGKSIISAIFDACDYRSDHPQPLDIETLKRSWRELLSAAEPGQVPVFSHEEMIRQQFYGRGDPTRMPAAMAAIAGPLKVVMVIRNQLTLIESLFLHKFLQFEEFQTLDRWLESDAERSALGYGFYDVASAWAEVVGQHNVGVFLFEELVNDAHSFANRLCTFVGIDPESGARLLMQEPENVRKGGRLVAYAKLRSWIFPNLSLSALLPAALQPHWRRFIEGGRRPSIEFPPEWRDGLEGYYAIQNRKLAERFRLPLDAYGYPLGGCEVDR